jgi:hypothetical protein
MKSLPMVACGSGALFAISILSLQCPTAFGQGTAFAYQGHLTDGSAAASGPYDLRFGLWDSVASGTQAGPTITNSPTDVSNGQFVVVLDFGAAALPGSDRWLEISVRAYGGSGWTTLAPRQKVTPVPYAIQAANSASAGALSGLILPSNIATSTITSAMLQLGAVTTARLADGSVTSAKLAPLTNVVLATSAGLLQFTNGTTSLTTGGTTPMMIVNFLTDTNDVAMYFGSAASPSGSIFLNRGHGSSFPGSSGNPHNLEWQIASPGNIAVGAGYTYGNAGHVQHGIGPSSPGPGGHWEFMQTQGPIGFTNGHSGAFAWRCQNAAGLDVYPGIISQSTSTNGPVGDWEMDIFPDLNVTQRLAGDSWDESAVRTNNCYRLLWGNQGTSLACPGSVSGASFVVTGTTNQISFGGTNTPPTVTSAPARWISVQVGGDGTSYRLPLYR